MGSITREMAMAEDARIQGTPAELGGTFTGHPPEDAFMVPGMGYQPVPPEKYVADNDNRPVCMPDFQEYPGAVDIEDAAETFGPLGQGEGINGPPYYNPDAPKPWDYIKARRLKTIAGYRVDNDGNRSIIYADGSSEPTEWSVHEVVAATRATEADTRHGDFMQTYTGRKFWPMDPRPDEVSVFDIAHSLSLQCRYAGHCKRFYSVAEHSTLMARWLRGKYGAEVAMWGLLHDAAEAYLVDVPRPVKPHLAGYKAAEAAVMRAVCIHFGLPVDAPPEVHEADERILADELVNLRPMEWHGRHISGLGVPMMYWSPTEAEYEFLATYRALARQLPGMWREAHR